MFRWILAGLMVFPVFARAAETSLVIAPEMVLLSHAQANQQLLVYEQAGSRVVGERTREARFESADPKIASVDAEGIVRPLGNGETTIVARIGTRMTRVTVRVTGADTPAVWSFGKHVQPVLTRTGCNMGACHGALAGKGGLKLSLRGYDDETDHFVLTRQALARRVDRNSPAESLLLRKAVRELPHGGGTRFTSDSECYRILQEWIAAGATGPRTTDPTLLRIEVTPANALLKPADTFRVSVRAIYSDKSIEDVTRWSKFLSNEESVATVNEDGHVSVSGSGEAAVSAIFGGKVATFVVTVPYPHRLNNSALKDIPQQNFIDERINEKLRLLRLPPSGPASDREFIRRASLDACGILPTPAEVEEFVKSDLPNKRAKLIEHLLQRPEYVDYWSHRWSDLLLISTRKLSQPSMWGFYRQIRSSVAQNQPWDRFARDILTASGSTITQGGGAYFVLHKDISELVESTAVTFMGMSLTCARCHNHPLEKWTQDQYWGLANLLSRVGLKNGERAGEVLVQSLPVGETRHPRRGIPMPPTPLDGRAWTPQTGQDRREYLVDWLTSPENPYFAKAIVNRVWRNFMGRGLVEAEDDLRDTNPATNPELLQALAKDFVANKYDMKKLMSTIMNSAAYQRSSKPLPENESDDRFYSRYFPRRLSAEVILDAYSDVSGVPTNFTNTTIGTSGGTSPTTAFPPGTRALQLPDSQLVSRFLDAFGRAERQLTCSCETTKESTVTQALHLSNGQTLNEKLRQNNSLVSRWIKADTPEADIVDQLFAKALARPPTSLEKKKYLAALSEARRESPAVWREVLEDAVWAVLSSKEFLFNR